MKKLICALSLSFLFFGSQAPANPLSPEAENVFEVLSTYYATDNMPIDAMLSKGVSTDLGTTFEVKFRGYDREWVTGRLEIPKGVQKPAVVILLHGLTQSKDQWWREEGQYSFPSQHRKTLVENGVAVLALDARNHGDRKEAKDFEDPYTYVKKQYFEAGSKMISETALDVRRAIDFLEAQGTVDTNRVGVAGFSLGGHIGWIASSVDHRIDRALIMAMPIIGNGPDLSPRFTEQQLYYPGLKDTPVMMIIATDDIFYTVQSATKVFDGLISKDKELVIIEGPHDLPISSAEYSKSFLADKLK
ncbi:alpha/beta fold hydrolase [Sneathiella sp. P13V-1]|uniref:alpha/beta hydrolase family protein n=1 Tax=Sneathiella sp. P13V-1 TaxID=2697366 RepID=UPI00187B92D0|nr:alpha/beta fold hydrolase [Sneathiella sp. P13V-1]MBE7638219.1 alpha/beta fold hydrolase [Sneathiella sp. P13V-1]